MPKHPLYNWDIVRAIVRDPKLLGHLCGKTLLEDIHSQWIHWAHDVQEDSLLQASRGSFKTTAIIEIGIMYRLLRNPDATIAIVRKSYSAAAEVIKAVCSMMEQPAVYELFRFVWFADKYGSVPTTAEWHFSVRKEGKINLSVRKDFTPECSVEALGLDSRFTGRHYNDCIILDDITDLSDRLYASERNYTKLVASEIRANIASPGCTSIFTGTAWHERDCLTELKEQGIRHIVYPYQILPFMSTDKIEQARKANGSLLFACNYELRFDSDADRIFTDPVTTPHWDFANVHNVKAHIDAAYSSPGDMDRDYCALTIMGELPGNKLMCVGWVEQVHAKDWIPHILEKMGKYRAKVLYAEDNSDKGFLLDSIRDDPRAASMGIFTQGYHEHTNKQAKISTALYGAWKNILFCEEGDPMYLEQILSWNETDKDGHDDAPDSCASLIREGGYYGSSDYLALYQAYK